MGVILPPVLIEDGPLAVGRMCVPFTSHIGMKETEDAISYAWRCRAAVWRPCNKSIPVQLKNSGFPLVGHLVVKIQCNKTISLAVFRPHSLVRQEVVTKAVMEVRLGRGTPVCTAPHTRKAHVGSKAYCFPCTINLHLHPEMERPQCMEVPLPRRVCLWQIYIDGSSAPRPQTSIIFRLS